VCVVVSFVLLGMNDCDEDVMISFTPYYFIRRLLYVCVSVSLLVAVTVCLFVCTVYCTLLRRQIRPLRDA
jgi:hypothetical protein